MFILSELCVSLSAVNVDLLGIMMWSVIAMDLLIVLAGR